ncbi:MAG: hypothetical protein J6R08_06190 [Opitutales bacterium]|nr:hypothetical protein [Opitutales bacterium]
MKEKTTQCNAYVRLHITLSKYIKTQAQNEANKLFAGNISAYIAYLIANATSAQNPDSKKSK